MVCERWEGHLTILINVVQSRTREHLPASRDAASIAVRRAQHGHLLYITEAIDFSLNRLIDKVYRLDQELIAVEEAVRMKQAKVTKEVGTPLPHVREVEHCFTHAVASRFPRLWQSRLAPSRPKKRCAVLWPNSLVRLC